MRCGGCASRVATAVQSVDSGAKVDVDLKSKTVRIDTRADPSAVASAITAAGYPATVSSSA
jgi:copper chaperone